MLKGEQIGRLVGNLKSKLKSLKGSKKPYTKVGKTDSMRVEIKSRRARKLVSDTLKMADKPGLEASNF